MPTEPVEITVAGTRLARTPGSAHVIHRRDLERFQYDDPHAVLAQAPGVYVRGEDGVGLRPNIGVRGTNPDRSKKITLLEDGILFGPAPYSAPAAYYFPLLARMTAVRVIKGPGAIAYGPQTIGGAVDLVTRRIPDATSGMFDLAFGEYGYNKAHGYFGGSAGNLGVLVEGVRLSNEGFKELPDGEDTGSTRNEWMVKTSYVLDPDAEVRHEFQAKLSYSDEVSNETYLGLTDADFRKDPDRRYPASALDRMENHRTSLVLSHTVDFSGVAKLTTHAYRHDFARVWRKVNRFQGASLLGVLREPELAENRELYDVLTGEIDSATGRDVLLIGPNDRTFESQGIASVFTWQGDTGPLAHRVEAGLRVHHDSILRRHSESGYRMIGGELVPDGTATRVTEANKAQTYAFALHALDAITWRSLTVTPGVRVELIDSEIEDHKDGERNDRFVSAVLPGIGLYSAVTDAFGVLAGVYRGFSPPPAGSDEAIEPEKSVNYEIGARYSAGATHAELIAFYNAYSNLTNTCTQASGCAAEDLDRQFDAGKARIGGLEAYARHQFAFGVLRAPLSIAYTLTRAEFSRSFQSSDPIWGTVRQGDEIPYVPRHQLSLSAALEGDTFGVAAAFNYVSAMREEPGTGPVDRGLATDEQVWVDFSANVRPLGWLTVYGNLRNAFDERHIVSHRPYGARPNAPRWLQMGAKVAF